MIVLPFPPSANHYWRHVTSGKLAGRVLISQEGRVFRDQVATNALVGKWPRFGADKRLRVRILAFMPDKRRRDLDGCLSAVKAGLDGIADAYQINDFNINPITIRRCEPVKGGRVEVRIA